MRTLILNRDLRALFAGAGGVVVAGLLCGAAMHPDLRGPADAEGPQMLMGVSGARAAYVGSASSWSYQGQVPDYVIGTDWLRPPEPLYAEDARAEEAEPSREPPQAYAAEERATDAVQTGWDEPAREPVVYPSTNGGAPYEADLPPAPEPPMDDEVSTIG
jgi:hypothetical protein